MSKIKIINYKTSLVLVILFFSSCSRTAKIDKGDLSGMCFYSSFAHETLFFYKSTVKIKEWDGYPLGKYTTLLSEKLVPYTYDANSKSGFIDQSPFRLSITQTNVPIYGVFFNGYSHTLQEAWSDDPSAPLIMIFGLIGIVAGVFVLYKKFKK